MTNILFLDIDGVLNHGQFGKDENDKFGFADDCIKNLKNILIKVPDTKLVISSSWRHFTFQGLVDKDTKNWRDTLCKKLDLPKSIIIGDIPDLPDANRSWEISKWLNDNKVKVRLGTYVILDDECVALKKMFPNNVIDCDINTGEGLSERKANEAIWILSGFNKDKANVQHWFTSDTHFGHANIIKYCNRPWNHGKDANGEIVVEQKDVLAMDNAMIERWNSVVGKNDIVWHLGDFALGGKANAERVFPQLNGKINLVMGNHDHWKVSWYYDLGFNRVYDRPVIINGFVILSHAPLQFLNSNSPFYSLFGHVHDSPAYATWSKTGCCVCVERHDYTPISWKMIKQKYEEINGKVE